jgi:hypothetical protein
METLSLSSLWYRAPRGELGKLFVMGLPSGYQSIAGVYEVEPVL